MKKAFPLLLCLALSSCYAPNVDSGNSGAAPATRGGTTTTSAGVAGNTVSGPSDPNAPPAPPVKSVTVDTTKRLEYVDIWTDLSDPSSQRALVPYLLKPQEWMLIKCEMLSPTSKHYTFQRVTTADGRSLPQVDLFKQGR